jgi:hypothetical protein
MHIRQPGDGPLPEFPDFARRVEEFPGPVAVAVLPPAGTLALCGGEESDGHPWALDVTYSNIGRDVLCVRTVRGTIDWVQVIRSAEDLRSTMGLFGDDVTADEAEYATSMTVDGQTVPGTRIDLPGRSGVHLEWRGQHVFCTGDPGALDVLELRTGTGADFARFTAEFEEFLARRRGEGRSQG